MQGVLELIRMDLPCIASDGEVLAMRVPQVVLFGKIIEELRLLWGLVYQEITHTSIIPVIEKLKKGDKHCSRLDSWEPLCSGNPEKCFGWRCAKFLNRLLIKSPSACQNVSLIIITCLLCYLLHRKCREFHRLRTCYIQHSDARNLYQLRYISIGYYV